MLTFKFKEDKQILGFGEKVQFLLLVLCTFSVICLLILTFVVFPILMPIILQFEMEFRNGSSYYARFLKSPIAIDFKIYLFHVENANEIVRYGAKPILTERGPYIYKETVERKVVQDNPEDDTITFIKHSSYIFDEEQSAPLTENDIVTTVNTPLLAGLDRASEKGLQEVILLSKCVHTIMEHTGLFMNITVRDLLFAGLNLCKRNRTENIACIVAKWIICHQMGLNPFIQESNHPDYMLKYSYFAYRYTYNDSWFTAKRGLQDSSTVGYLVKWNNMSYLHTWKEEKSDCNRVFGSVDAMYYSRPIHKNSRMTMYTPDICRHVNLSYLEDSSYKTFKGYQFVTTKDTFRSLTPEMDCFCSKSTTNIDGNKSCYLNGLLDLQSCIGAPVLLSHPHFLWVDESVQNGVDGLHPDEMRHRSELLVEPNTGIPMIGKITPQMNIPIRPIEGADETANLTRVILPLLWYDELGYMTDDLLDELDLKYFIPMLFFEMAKWVLPISLVGLIVANCVFLYRHYN